MMAKARSATEIVEYTIRPVALGYRLEIDVVYRAATKLHIGSKEEGGLAVRVATPMNVNKGGKMVDNHGRVGGKQIWGKRALYVDYNGIIDKQTIGILVMAT